MRLLVKTTMEIVLSLLHHIFEKSCIYMHLCLLGFGKFVLRFSLLYIMTYSKLYPIS